MELSFAQCEKILDTLPIGYYANRRIGVSLNKEEKTSYYSMMDDTIVVSYPIIAERSKKLSNTANPEEAVRSMLYHEVSHAILTPKDLDSNAITNIFEDERIESLLANYYIGVDFKAQVRELCGEPSTPTTPEQAFFNAVRLGAGSEEIQQEITALIEKYGTMTQNASQWDCLGYARDIYTLYIKIAKEYKMKPTSFEPQKIKVQLSNGNSKSQGFDSFANEENENGDDGSEGQGENANDSRNKRYNKATKDSARNICLSKEQIKDITGKALNPTSNLPINEQKELEAFKRSAETIIANFNKKNSGGSGINTYSGVFNPRSVGRTDYRYFDRSMTTQGNNRFGTCHLNLFIDCSGSFQRSQNLVNGILAVLSEIERKNRNFSMDVSFINNEYRDCNTVSERSFDAIGGNDIPANMKQRFLKRQLPNTCNYNIVLFDGDAFSNSQAELKEQIRRFSAFDYKQTTLITDSANKFYMGKGFTSSKVVITHNYTGELISHLIKALTIAFG